MDIFDYFAAKKKTVGLVSIPHPGEIIPDQFRSFLSDDLRALAEDVDYKINELLDIDQLNDAGIDVLVAKIHRTCVDLNRPEQSAVLNWKKNSQGIQIVMNEPTEEEYKQLQQSYYTPYFDQLKKLIEGIDREIVPVVDFHSMPSAPTNYHLKQNPDQKKSRPDFCVSDLKGESCQPAFIEKAVNLLKENGFDATFNDPYFGGYVTKYINQFKTNNIQIETKRALYMDEKEREIYSEKVAALKPVLTRVIIELLS